MGLKSVSASEDVIGDLKRHRGPREEPTRVQCIQLARTGTRKTGPGPVFRQCQPGLVAFYDTPSHTTVSLFYIRPCLGKPAGETVQSFIFCAKLLFDSVCASAIDSQRFLYLLFAFFPSLFFFLRSPGKQTLHHIVIIKRHHLFVYTQIEFLNISLVSETIPSGKFLS